MAPQICTAAPVAAELKTARDARFTSLYPEITRKINAIAGSLGLRQEADDLVSVVYERWAAKGDPSRTDAEIISYCARLALWRTKNIVAYNSRFASPPAGDDCDDDCDDYIESFADHRPSPETVAIHNSSYLRLVNITETLAPAERSAVRALIDCDWSGIAAAAALGCSPAFISKAKSALFAACRKEAQND
ncbi:MAG: hypothetical protein A2X82_09100 [Geobacteraceae bacterium GWC2_55_20]|nr:MAG: hypothetical protein A2X82_09100 [Geobacteraceae bacterium GWC2_55_20]